MKPRHQRMVLLGGGLLLVIAGVILLLQNFRENLVYFYSPTELLALEAPEKRLRIGGMVEEGSISYDEKELTLQFITTDYKHDVTVDYQGSIPALFREGQGVVAEGYWHKEEQRFIAERILTKHDENYMPPEVKRALADGKP